MINKNTNNVSDIIVENLMTPENIGKAIDLLSETLPLLFEVMLKRLEQTQDLLSKKIDQIILRDIYSAFGAIKDATSTLNEETKQIRLKFAEESLLRNTGLDPSIETGGYSNSHWMAQSHHGLMQICSLRRDSKIAVKHLLNTYICDPRDARKTLSPEIFVKVFQPMCKEIYKWEEEQITEINKSSFSKNIILRKVFSVGKFGIKGAASAVTYYYSKNRSALSWANNATEELKKEWKEATPEEFKVMALNELSRQVEEKLDDKCKEIGIILHTKV
jgi:hypothetical protein